MPNQKVEGDVEKFGSLAAASPHCPRGKGEIPFSDRSGHFPTCVFLLDFANMFFVVEECHAANLQCVKGRRDRSHKETGSTGLHEPKNVQNGNN